MPMWHLRSACWVTKPTNAHSRYLILKLLHCNSGCTDAPHCYVTLTLPVFVCFGTLCLHVLCNWLTPCLSIRLYIESGGFISSCHPVQSQRKYSQSRYVLSRIPQKITVMKVVYLYTTDCDTCLRPICYVAQVCVLRNKCAHPPCYY
jgi:hypothetical protein